MLKLDHSEVINVADRYMYLPSIGICILVAIWLVNLSKVFTSKHMVAKVMPTAIILILFVLLFGKTFMQVRLWENSFDLWDYSLKVEPRSEIAFLNRGNASSEMGRKEEALSDFTKAIELNDSLYEAYVNRSNILNEIDDFAGALKDLEKAEELNDGFAGLYVSRGSIYAKIGKYDLAIEEYTRAIELDGSKVDAYLNRGNVYSQVNEFDKALGDYNMAATIEPEFGMIYYNKAIVYQKRSEYLLAIENAGIARGLGYPGMDMYVNSLTKMYESLPK